MLNGKFVYPSTNYSTNQLAGPDYSGASSAGFRYATFQVTGPSNKASGSLNITATGLSQRVLSNHLFLWILQTLLFMSNLRLMA